MPPTKAPWRHSAPARPSGTSLNGTARDSAPATRATPRNRVLLLIAAFKFVKALLLLAVGLGALDWLHPAAAEEARRWAAALAFSSGQRILQHALVVVSRMSPERVGLLGLGAFAYAALFATEGVGLWKQRRWAEYLTVVATGSFIPFELYEIIHQPTVLRVAALIANVLVVVYLIFRLRWRHRERERASAVT
jgi:uncharacterized membrane protein (DUF2068 family)